MTITDAMLREHDAYLRSGLARLAELDRLIAAEPVITEVEPEQRTESRCKRTPCPKCKQICRSAREARAHCQRHIGPREPWAVRHQSWADRHREYVRETGHRCPRRYHCEVCDAMRREARP